MLRAYYPKSFTIVSDLDTASALALDMVKDITPGAVGGAILLKDLINISPLPRVFLPFCGFFVGHGKFGKKTH